MSATLNVRFILRLSLITLLTYVLAVLANPDSSDLEPLFKVAKTGDRAGCDDTQITNLQKSYREAREMIKAGRKAVEALQKPRPAEGEQAQDWNRKSRMLAAIFGIKTDPKSGPAGKDKQLLDSVHGKQLTDVFPRKRLTNFVNQGFL